MRHPVSSSVDVRRFHWPLATLERRRALAVEEAALRLAQAERGRSAAEEQLHRAEAEQSEQAGSVNASLVMDPALRLHALAYLARNGAQIALYRDALLRAERTCGSARVDLQRAHRDIDVLTRLRETALAAFGVQEARREAKHADLAWLAHQGAPKGHG